MPETLSQTAWGYQAWIHEHANQMDNWTADQVRANFAEFEAKEAELRLDLAQRKVGELRSLALQLGHMHARELRKSELIADICDRMARHYIPGTLTYRSWTIGSGEKPQTMREAVKERLAALTDEELAENRARHSEARARVDKALSNPETYDEFRTFLAHLGPSALTPEQGERWDELLAARRRAASHAKPAQPPTGFTAEVKEGWHAKEQRKTFVVTLGNRLSDAAFGQLRQEAKTHGGYWSNFRGSGAIPGFQFKTAEAAASFHAAVQGTHNAAASPTAAEEPEAAPDRLLAQAQRIEQAAQEELGKDRLTNTARRAGMAAGIEARARSRLALAASMQRIAATMREGRLVHLGQVRHATHVEELEARLRQARWARLHAAQERDQVERQPLDKDDVLHAAYPWPRVNKSTLHDAVKLLVDRPGHKRLCNEVSKFASDGKEEWWVQLASHEDVERIYQFATLAKEAGGRVSDLFDSLAGCRRLAAMDIRTAPELRCALREYLGLRRSPEADDPVRRAERELIGTKIPGFFPTPPSVIQLMLEHAELADGQRLLEPSAGKGDLLDAVNTCCPGVECHAIEISSTLRQLLELKGHNVVAFDFLEYSLDELFDRILMNPPFEGGQDIEHVQKAFQHLRPGGRLVAVMSNGPFFRSDSKSTAFRAWLEGVGHAIELPEGSFHGRDAFRQTGVSTRLVIITKPQ